MPDKRIVAFDLAKLIAIIAVIISHTAIRFLGLSAAGDGSQVILAACFTFHLPLFFIVSGYFLRHDGSINIAKEAKQLFPAYILTCFVVIVGVVLANIAQGGVISNRVLLLDWINASIFGAGDMVSNPLWPQTTRIGAIWFILALFWARLIVSLSYKTKYPWLAIGIVFLAAIYSTKIVFLPFSIQPGMTSALFVYFGTCFRRYSSLKSTDNSAMSVRARKLTKHLIMAACLSVWLLSIAQYTGFSMATNGYGITAYDYLRNIGGGVASTYLILQACRDMERRFGASRLIKSAARIGRMTLLVLCLHLIEDNILPWPRIVDAFSTYFTFPASWLLLAMLRSTVIVALAIFISKVNLVSVIFGIKKDCQNVRIVDLFGPSFKIGKISLWSIIILICWMPYAISFYPGIVEIDSAFQIGEAIGLGMGGATGPGSWTSLFPYGSAMLMGGLYSVGTYFFQSQTVGIAILLAFQMLCLAASLSFSICYLEKWSVPVWMRCVIVLITALNPVLAIQVVTVGKDPLFSISIVVTAVCVAESIRDFTNYRNSLAWIVLSSLAAISMVCLRSSGAMIVCAIWAFPLARFFWSRKLRQRFLLKSALYYVMPVLMACFAVFANNLFAKSHVVVDSMSLREIAGTMMQQTTAVYRDDPNNLSEEEIASLSEFYDIDIAAEHYEPQMNDQVKIQINPNVTSSHFWKFFIDWARIGIRYPSIYLKAWYQLISGYIVFGDYDSIALPRFMPTENARDILDSQFADGVDINGNPEEVVYVLLETGSPYSAELLPEYSAQYPWFGDWGMPDDTLYARELIFLSVAKFGSIPIVGWLVSKPLFVFWLPLLLLGAWIHRRKDIPLSLLVPLGCMSVLALFSPVDLTRYCVPSMVLLPLTAGLVLAGKRIDRSSNTSGITKSV